MDRMMTAVQIARQLNVSAYMVRLWTRTGRIPCLYISRKLKRYDLAEVRAALARPVVKDGEWIDAGR